MESYKLLDSLEFHEPVPFAEPLLVDQNIRILRWMLRPGQQVKEHAAPGSPFYVVVLRGRGLFAGPDGREEEHGPGSLLIFDSGEPHSVRAVDEDLVFVGFLHGVDAMRPDHAGGVLGRA